MTILVLFLIYNIYSTTFFRNFILITNYLLEIDYCVDNILMLIVNRINIIVINKEIKIYS